MIIGQNEFGDCPVPFLDVRTGPDCHETLEDLLCITDFPVLLQGFNGLQLFPTYEVRNFNFHTFHMIVNRYQYMIINDTNNNDNYDTTTTTTANLFVYPLQPQQHRKGSIEAGGRSI